MPLSALLSMIIIHYYQGLPVMNTAVTAAVPEKFYCQSSTTTCHPSWARSGKAYKKDLEKDLEMPQEDEGSDERVGKYLAKLQLSTEVMCKVVDCDFLPSKNVGSLKH